MLVGLERVVGGDHLTAIVNTADDATIYGVHVSPDVDIVTYWLAGIADTHRGWGIRGDTTTVIDALRELGVNAWFALGDRDLATCLRRTEMLRQGMDLTSVTAEICHSFGVATTVLPMSDLPVRTMIVTADGRTLEFQEYFVKERTEPEVAEIRIETTEGRDPGSGVLEAIRGSDAVIVCPSNPLLSIDPILSLTGTREALLEHPNVIAITPIIGGRALKGPADRLLKASVGEASASAVARHYGDLVDSFVVDASDPEEAAKVGSLGVRCLQLDTIMRDHQASERLARQILGA